MPKLPIPIAHDMSSESRTTKIIRAALFVVVGVILAGPAVEVASMCYGQWCQILDKDSDDTQTPILDSVQDGVQSAHQSAWAWIAPYFQRVPWSPSLVLPIAAVVTLVGIMLMKA
jgi:hypothetical protein